MDSKHGFNPFLYEATLARPRKCRRICSKPQNHGFEPIGENKNRNDFVILNLDEYEVIRLIDLESELISSE